LTIDNQKKRVPEGATILEAARQVGIKIPTLCYLEGFSPLGACRICLVEVKGARALQPACATRVSDGMEVITSSPRVRKARRTTLELILSDHPYECPTCIRNLNCELQDLAEAFGIRAVRFEGERFPRPLDDSGPALVREMEKCILCRRCVQVCEHLQSVKAIAPQERGFETVIAPPFGVDLVDVDCVFCGQCTLVCPTGALHERDSTAEVWAALADPRKHVVVQTAPATRVSVGEGLGMEPGSDVTGQLVTALRRLGFDRVFDTTFGADLTIVEEAHELIQRIQEGGRLPMITSCSPGWVKFIEHNYPHLLDHLSTCKSPQQMLGALVKTYYARKAGLDPADIYVVSIMPCTAKKFEAVRDEMRDSGYQDVDAVLTTRELCRMLKEAAIDFSNLPEEDYDAPLGIGTGAAALFGASGGVMEAALRTAYEVITGKTLEPLEFTPVRGLKGIKEAALDVDGLELKVAVAHTLGNARKLLDLVDAGQADYHFIEVMACPGGCIGGGGQPIPSNDAIRARRVAAMYTVDERMTLRKSHENPALKQLYAEFLGKPLGHRSHELLHTHYTRRSRY